MNNIDEILVTIIQVYLMTAIVLRILNQVIRYKKNNYSTELANQMTYVSFAWPYIVIKIILVGQIAITKIMLNVLFGIKFDKYYSINWSRIKKNDQ